MSAREFLSTSPYEASHPDAIAIYCSDGRFTNPVEELLHALGHPRLDTVTLPGGPALYNAWLSGMSDSITIANGTRFLIEAHGIKRAIMIAHEGCGFYKKHYARALPAEVRTHQESDLRLSARTIRRDFPKLDVLLYFARVSQARVKFEPIPETAAIEHH